MPISKEAARPPLVECWNGRNTQPRKQQHVYGKKAKANSTTGLLASFNKLSISDIPCPKVEDVCLGRTPEGQSFGKESPEIGKRLVEKNIGFPDGSHVASPLKSSIEKWNSLEDENPDIEFTSEIPAKKNVRTVAGRKQASRALNRGETDNKFASIVGENSRTTRAASTSRRKTCRKSIETISSLSPLPLALGETRPREVSRYLQPLVQLSNLGFRSTNCFGQGFPKHLVLSQIASGSFGEVFVLTKSKSQKRPIAWTAPDVCAVFKVIPLNAEKGKGSRKYSKVDDVVSEVKISLRMDEISGFLRFRDVHIVQGPFPTCLRDAAEEYREGAHTHESPDWRTFPEDQVFAIIEMDYAGRQLESILRERPSVQEIYDIFWLVASTLALGERNTQFEHRDLHISNICVRPRRSNLGPLLPTSSNSAPFGFANIGITIIDFTYSRTALTTDLDDKVSTAATEMKDTWFRWRTASNEQERLQNDAYERVLNHIECAGAAIKPSLRWKHFFPGTNYIWLEYLLASLLSSAAIQSEDPTEVELHTRLKKCSSDLEACGESESLLERGAMGIVERAEAAGWVGEGDMARVEEVMNNDI